MPKQYSTLITCNHCQQDLPHDAYRWTKTGTLHNGRTCAACASKRQMVRYHERIREPKTGVPPTICNTCKRELPATAFGVNRQYDSGFSPRCFDCSDTERQRRSKTYGWFKEYKKSLSCAACGEATSCCLEFHHRNPAQKDGNIARMATMRSLTALQEEIAKCIVYCSNCHKKYHAGLLKV